jgi:lipopolysaccharide export system permease protein
MRLLDRYLLREFLIPLGYCISGFLIFWIAFDLFSELHAMQEKHLLVGDIAQYYLFRIPEFLPVALPVALLLALLYAVTNHGRNNELTAMRTAGISLWRLSAPYLAVGFLASLALFALNEFCAPITSDAADQILASHSQPRDSAEERHFVRNLTFKNAAADRFWGPIAIYNQVTGEMIKPRVDWGLPDGSRRTIEADRAVRTNGVWTFYRVRELRETTATNSLPSRMPQTDVLAMPEFSETPEQINSIINIRDRFGHRTRTHRADVPIREILNCLQLNPNPDKSLRSWLYTKLQGRFAGPCTCWVVVLIAVPFAAARGRRNAFVGVAASISIFFVYYLLQQFGFALGEVGRVPPWLGAWLPNLVFGAAGLWMMARAQ